jgi:hypothetical protein
MKHPVELDLALYASGDLSGWSRLTTAMHVRGCDACRGRVEGFRLDRERLQAEAGDMPMGVNWDRLAAEMTANIRVGLAAGECVAPVSSEARRPGFAWNWRPVGAVAGLALVFCGAWWLNIPPGDAGKIGNIFTKGKAVVSEDRGPVVEASSDGIEFRENGSALGVGLGGAQPVSVSVSFEGSASARYVDDDTGQVTIATVYVQ